MDNNKKFIINLDELKKLCQEGTSKDTKMGIQIDVLSRPYKEPSAAKVIGSGIMTGLKKGISAIDEMTKPPEKKKPGDKI